MQFANENQDRLVLPRVNVKDTDDISENEVTATLRRALSFHSTLQAHDGHWPGDNSGPMFFMAGLVSFKFTASFSSHSLTTFLYQIIDFYKKHGSAHLYFFTEI